MEEKKQVVRGEVVMEAMVVLVEVVGGRVEVMDEKRQGVEGREEKVMKEEVFQEKNVQGFPSELYLVAVDRQILEDSSGFEDHRVQISQ